MSNGPRSRRASLATALLVTGCAVGPNYRAPPILDGRVPPPALTSAKETAFVASAPISASWWKLYDDPVLDRLIEKALTHNTDLRQALESLEEAQAALAGIQAQRTPQTSFSGSGSYGKSSISGMDDVSPSAIAYFSLMESVSYDLDLFGKLRRGVEEAKADVEEVQATLDLARVNIAASTAEAYASSCADGLSVELTRHSVELARESLELTQRRHDHGLASATDVTLADEQLKDTASSLPTQIAQQRSDQFKLATLVGDPPEIVSTDVASCITVPRVRRAIPVGDGAELLARRPDVRESERKLAAAIADIGVSTSAMYPSVTIGGSVGKTQTSLGGTKINIFTWNVGGMLSWTFPNVSEARAKVAQSNASARSALASFDGTILTALKETETALTKLARELDAERELAAARDDAESFNADTTRKFAKGVADFSDVLSSRRALVAAETSLASATSEVAQDQISLFMALGGGWQDAPPVAETSLEPVIAHKPTLTP